MSVSYSKVDNELVAEHTSTPTRDALREWDELVERSRADDVAQISAWADIRATHGYRPTYIFVRHQDRLIAGAQILCRRVPVLGTIGYLPFGPVIALDVDSRDQVTERLTAELSRSGRQLRMLFVQPPVGAEDVSAPHYSTPASDRRMHSSRREHRYASTSPRRKRSWSLASPAGFAPGRASGPSVASASASATPKTYPDSPNCSTTPRPTTASTRTPKSTCACSTTPWPRAGMLCCLSGRRMAAR